jgi:hypothetical protein
MLLGPSANAALVSRLSGQAYYDTVLDITWLADANLAATNTFGVGGAGSTMTWDVAQSWIVGMNAANYLGLSNWRLPNADVNADNFVVSCSLSTEAICRDNEMGYMFYQNHVNQSLPAPFTGIAFDHWSGTVNPSNSTQGYEFDFFQISGDGGSGFFAKTKLDRAWAVASGDPLATPIPAAAWLFGGALGVLGVLKRRAKLAA